MRTTFFTPSYINDLDRAIWMRKSIVRFFQGKCQHFIAVPERDVDAFRKVFSNDKAVEVVCQHDAVEDIFYPDFLYRTMSKLAKSQLWRFESHAGRPGWIIQQVVKMNCVRWVKDGAIVFVDSDVIFIRPCCLRDLGIDDNSRILVRITPKDEASKHRAHIAGARKLLSLPIGTTEHHYMSSPSIWYADWTKSLHDYIEKATSRDWQGALCATDNMSEYSIYGTYVEEILRPANLVVRTKPFHGIVWDNTSFMEFVSNAEASTLTTSDVLTLVVQSNLGIPVSKYESVLMKIIESERAW